jgi:hypothetical protein
MIFLKNFSVKQFRGIRDLSVEWKPIAHSISKSVEEIELQQQANK